MIAAFKKNIWLIAQVFVAIIFLAYFYGQSISNANGVLFSSSGDAIKNYYSLAHHVVNDSTFVYSDGMHYPYGDLITYADGTPLVANTLRVISSFFPGAANYTIGVLHLSMFLSLFLAFIFIHLIFRKLAVPGWYAIIASLAIIFLEPQVPRMTGHFGLGYAHVIPMCILLFMTWWDSSKKIKWSIIAFVSVFLGFYLHPYTGMMATLFLMTMFLVKYVASFKSLLKDKKYYLHWLLQGILPAILFMLITKILDDHTGRTETPQGFFLDKCGAESVFIPTISPTRAWFDAIGTYGSQKWEALAYVGIPTTAFLIVAFFRAVIKWIRGRKNRVWIGSRKPAFQIMIVAAVFVLFFSMAIPFRWNMEFLLDVISPLKQFRAIGRFAWVFYYTITIFMFYRLYVYYRSSRRLKGKILTISAIVISVFFFIYEGEPFHTISSGQMKTGLTNIFKTGNDRKSTYLDQLLTKVPKGKYQAIIPLPFYHKTGEIYCSASRNDDEVMTQTMFLSYHQNIPIVGALLARTSEWESRELFELTGPGLDSGSVFGLLNDKPFLVVRSNEWLDPYEVDFLKRCKTIYLGEHYGLYEISPNEMKNRRKEILAEFEEKKEELHEIDNYLTDNPDGVQLVLDYDDNPIDSIYAGGGGISFEEAGTRRFNMLMKDHKSTLIKGKKYVISFWYNIAYPQAMAMTAVIDQNGGWTGVSLKSSHHFDGNWALVRTNFFASADSCTLSIFLDGKNNADKLAVDNLIITEENTNVYQENEKGEVLINNMKVVKSKD